MIHQALYLKEMVHHLICPFQLQLNDVIMNEIPLAFVKGDNNDKSTPHTIIIPSNTPDGEPLTIPLDLRGVMSGFRVRKLTKEEIDDPDQFPQY